jgi:hypothetical protein
MRIDKQIYYKVLRFDLQQYGIIAIVIGTGFDPGRCIAGHQVSDLIGDLLFGRAATQSF